MLKVAVLVSGRGSNLQALIDICADPAFPAEIVTVISNIPDVYGLERAQTAGIATDVVNHRDFENRESFETALQVAISKSGAELICLAGFMRILTAGFVNRWRDRLVNIHPSLLPSFKGLHVHEQALEAGVKISGCTVHFVVPEMDAGPIIVQEAVPVLPGDDADALAARILEAEHRCYPHALRLIAEGRAEVVGERVEIK
jgi:phosphoribosylglycinamide formyltransferase-1